MKNNNHKVTVKNLQIELQLLRGILSGYRDLDRLNDHYQHYFSIGLSEYSEEQLNELIDGKRNIQSRIKIYESKFLQIENILLQMGEDPFPATTEQQIAIENELMKDLPMIKRKKRARFFVWMYNLFNNNKP